jgi:hypothetical protein
VAAELRNRNEIAVRYFERMAGVILTGVYDPMSRIDAMRMLAVE